METSELDRRLILGIADLDAATNRLWVIERSISQAIDDLKLEWCEANEWRAGADDWEESDRFYVAPPAWAPNPDDWVYWFQLDFEHGKPEYDTVGGDSFWLTKLCGEGYGGMGFRLSQKGHKAAKWKAFLREQAGVLAGTRFILDDQPSIYLPIKVDKAALAEAVAEENCSAGLKPIKDALDYIRDHSPRFIELLKTIDAEVR